MTPFTPLGHRCYPPGFADDPVASHSAQFGLARPSTERAAMEEPSPPGVRPWCLLAAVARSPRGPRLTGISYDHKTQTAVTAAGQTLGTVRGKDPTANSVSQLDGDEGQSEDWSYDFCPDQPGEPW